MPRGWFIYTRNDADRTLAGSYVFAGLNPETDFECSGYGEVCAIYAVYGGTTVVGVSHPSAPLTPGISSYINLAPFFSANLPLDGKTYLYVCEA